MIGKSSMEVNGRTRRQIYTSSTFWVSVAILLMVSNLSFASEQSNSNPFAVMPTIEPKILKKTENKRKHKLIKNDVLSELSESIEFSVIPLVNANCDELVKVFDSTSRGGLLSPLGSISTDVRSNSLIIMDTPSVIQKVRDLVSQLDVPVQQVEIEARIVVMSEGALDEIGVRWGILQQGTTLPLGGSINGSSEESVSSDRIDQQLAINLPATSSSASSLAFQLATLGSGTLLDLELSALQSESKAEVISSPRLITTNRRTAYIEQGTEIPYQESSSDGESSIEFKKAVLSLEVTPYLSENDQFILDLTVTQDQPGEVVKTGTGEAVAITTQRMATQVKVRDGETIVLGGVKQQSTSDSSDKVPVLGDLPILGKLFRRDYQQMTKSELLIFVTPTLLIQ
ncbi:type IV pilus secretin PilQ [Vibrio sp. WJH972]